MGYRAVLFVLNDDFQIWTIVWIMIHNLEP